MPAPEPAPLLPDPGSAARALDDGTLEELVREEPLVIEVGEQRVVTMRTPGQDRDLAIGFLLGEGVVDHASAVTGEAFVPGDAGERRADHITITVAPRRARVTGRLTRTHEIRSSCGICGLVDADELLEDLPPLLPGVPAISEARIERLRSRFESTQHLFHRTGACHGAELFGPDDASWGRGEDVGRHNALDKAIGAAARAGHDLAHATAMLSGRAGFDLVVKCLRLRIPIIMSVSAASALSFDMCRAAGATLIGFVRPGRSKVYLAGGRFR
jgi:FdhD protein